jgi:hypothetical protein
MQWKRTSSHNNPGANRPCPRPRVPPLCKLQTSLAPVRSLPIQLFEPALQPWFSNPTPDFHPRFSPQIFTPDFHPRFPTHISCKLPPPSLINQLLIALSSLPSLHRSKRMEYNTPPRVRPLACLSCREKKVKCELFTCLKATSCDGSHINLSQ